MARLKKNAFLLSLCLLAALSFYGLGRLYYAVTDGFWVSNIVSELPYDRRWETTPLSDREHQAVGKILDQPFHYLGKGCQSYVFESADGQYVMKFFKYQRFRTPTWPDSFAFIPAVKKLQEKKRAKKKRKREKAFYGWVTAFNHLKEETALVYVHLNKGDQWGKTVTIYDKVGMRHTLPIDQMEFAIQKKATMLTETLDQLMKEGKEVEAKHILSNLVALVADEYRRGFVDNDHALMQNTGVRKGKPVHIDIGQFFFDERAFFPQYRDQEIFNKMYKFRLWLKEAHPSLLTHIDQELVAEMGEKFYALRHLPR